MDGSRDKDEIEIAGAKRAGVTGPATGSPMTVV
jgi:hypothetical protein